MSLIRYLLKVLFNISIYEPPTDLPVAGRLLAEHFYSAEFRNDMSHDIPTFREARREV
jgi:hypothetical protein